MIQELKEKIEKILGSAASDEREVLSQLRQLVFETELPGGQTRDSKDIAALVTENLKQMKSKTPNANSIKSGFAEFDVNFGGFGLGEFVVIGGRPSMGKTQLLVNLALNMSTAHPVLYFTFDLSESILTNRFISSLSGVAVSKILQGDLSDEEHQVLAAIEPVFAQHKILLNDSCSNSMTDLRAHCKQQIEAHGVKVIIIDYLQLMSATKHRNNRELEISYISRALKNIARDFNVCVIATSQLSRAVEVRGGAKIPQLSDLRESGALEQDADKVIFIYRPEYYGISCDEVGNDTTGVTELILAKNRNGALGSVKLKRNDDFTCFTDYIPSLVDFTFSKKRLDELKGSSPF